MKTIFRKDYPKFFNTLTIEDKKYLEMPTIMCIKCHELVCINIFHNPDCIEIQDCSCDIKK